ncbi:MULTISPECIES: DEAD/DEAH box helicase [unclassified Lentimonas]|uniref:DEAD/DEAH box helicase n=1 Tax=unclassified Lentimonas TaxID=2630993 RepID=UPI0013285AB5|nr:MULTISPECIES: DEAD/DEAH box helicase [unclassified Lentimonas]CAA6677903.1 Helicase, SNF2/RAD54 family [Lentimonas sp. CC4]CAA6684007.1 Helicase, SNF2/RAD54 family [Lentimonas sp. CC6]CAA7076617.1 Helicase, SNF2/RAD54 family [Lentimonas sp. CC4]CAA7170054.1 Helicase, SNF2/RAD54 family [Lentimonas sp. CC21]CAA7181339.1 Helicase, SNF2/RAD54 family [Lentimonas sp. CC8]
MNSDALRVFEDLPVEAFRRVADPTYLQQGLAYFRTHAVKNLRWDSVSREMVATIWGSRSKPYRVDLWGESGNLEHRCDCPAWENLGQCKHCVAAAAALYSAIHEKSFEGISMPDTYIRELRRQLGYVSLEDAPTVSHAQVAKVTTVKNTLLLTVKPSTGDIAFKILGQLPGGFLSAVASISEGDATARRLAREFSLQDVEAELPLLLSEANEHGVEVLIEVGQVRKPLKIGEGTLQPQYVLNICDDEVVAKMIGQSDTGERLEILGALGNTYWGVAEDGTLYDLGDNSAVEYYHLFSARHDSVRSDGLLPSPLSIDDFSMHATVLPFEQAWVAGAQLRFACEGEDSTIIHVEEKDVRLAVNMTAGPNARTAALGFAIEVRGHRISLLPLIQHILQPVLEQRGDFFNAKSRVRALMDTLRQYVAADAEGRLRIRARVSGEIPEFFGAYQESIVLKIFSGLDQVLSAEADGYRVLGVDSATAEWVSYPIPIQRLAMSIFSFFEPETRDDIRLLEKGHFSVEGTGARETMLQRASLVSRTMQVDFKYENQSVRSAPVKVELTSELERKSDIDWFALHPSIQCNDRQLSGAEWQLLVRGELLLRDDEGNWIIPDLGVDEEASMHLLAEMFAKKDRARVSKRGEHVEEAIQISRLEMLDWLSMRRSGLKITLPPEAEELFQSLRDFEQLAPFTLPKGFNADLRPYQNEGCAWIEFLYQHRFGACLADDMGLGKTVQTIGFIAERLQTDLKDKTGAILIVLPPSLVFNWLDEFERFAPDIRVQDCLTRGSLGSALETAEVILTTYDRVRVEVAAYEAHHFDVVVFDEAHSLKNVTAARTKAAARVTRRFTLCLTGTPVENNISEFYSVLSTSVPGIFGTLKHFKEAFRRDPERLLGRAKPFILRRTKDKILKELPRKEEHELFLEMSPMQKEMYARTVAEVREEVAEAFEDRPGQQAGIVALAAILRLRQVCVSPELLNKPLKELSPKFAYMADKLEELESEGNAALVFSQFRGALDQMEKVAKQAGVRYLRMDGHTPMAKRKKLVQEFQSEDGPSFFFISLKTGGVGLNLTRANYVFHVDPWWNPAVENQASDRAHRIGQKRSVFVQRLVMKHTIEERMLDLKARKAELFRQLVDEPSAQSSHSGLSRTDFEFLING